MNNSCRISPFRDDDSSGDFDLQAKETVMAFRLEDDVTTGSENVYVHSAGDAPGVESKAVDSSYAEQECNNSNNNANYNSCNNSNEDRCYSAASHSEDAVADEDFNTFQFWRMPCLEVNEMFEPESVENSTGLNVLEVSLNLAFSYIS